MIRTELIRIATAATFLTRLPLVARWASPNPAELGRSTRWFPLIGVLVGAIGGLAYLAAATVWSREVAALIALAVMVLSTGAFHEDGWADTFDGLFGGWTAERRLEIMRDSRIGTYGALALLLLLLGKWQALAALSPAAAVVVLIAAHAMARWSTLPLARALPYVREGGPMKPVASGIGVAEVSLGAVIVLLAMTAVVVHVGWWLPVIATSASLLVMAGGALLYRMRLGGVTGDALGAANQAVELVWLLTASAVLSAR